MTDNYYTLMDGLGERNVDKIANTIKAAIDETTPERVAWQIIDALESAYIRGYADAGSDPYDVSG